MSFKHVLICALSAALPLAAGAQEARTTKAVNLRAGPDRDYPLVARYGPGTPLAVQGCTDGFAWCDVIAPDSTRGWVYAGNIAYPYQSSSVPVLGYGAVIGLPVVTFVIGSYWGDYYRNRPWYGNRDRWAHHRPPPRPPAFRPPPPRPPGFRPPPGDHRPPPGVRPPGGDHRPPGMRPPGDTRPPGVRPPGHNRPPPGVRPPGGERPGGGGRPPGGGRPGGGGGRPDGGGPAPSTALKPAPALPSPNYLAGYPGDVQAQVQQLIAQGRLAERLRSRYGEPHGVRTDAALYDYTMVLKTRHLRSSGPVSKVVYDNRLQVIQNALGTHTTVSRVQGTKLKAKREIRIAGIFRTMPEPLLKMIVVHELAHLKERAHDKAFYALCQYMEADYHQLEFDLRLALMQAEASGQPVWPADALKVTASAPAVPLVRPG